VHARPASTTTTTSPCSPSMPCSFTLTSTAIRLCNQFFRSAAKIHIAAQSKRLVPTTG
jgi:hypothetical protein